MISFLILIFFSPSRILLFTVCYIQLAVYFDDITLRIFAISSSGKIGKFMCQAYCFSLSAYAQIGKGLLIFCSYSILHFFKKIFLLVLQYVSFLRQVVTVKKSLKAMQIKMFNKSLLKKKIHIVTLRIKK